MSCAPSELNTILRAGAGAGKTTRLTQEFLLFAKDFKSKNGVYPRIVVTTFTRKATQELKERLLAKALEDGDNELFQFVSSKSQVQISTIHGVLSIFLSRYGAAIGLTPDYKIMSEAEIKKGARKIIRKYLLEDPQLQELLEEYDFAIIEKALFVYFSEKIVFPDMAFMSKAQMQADTAVLVQDIGSRLRRVALEISSQANNDKWQEYAQQLSSFSWSVVDVDWKSFFDRLENFWSNLSKPAFRKASAPFSLSLNDELEEIRERVDKLLEEPRYHPEFWEKHQKNCELFARLAAQFSLDFMNTKLAKGLLSMSDLEGLSVKMIREAPEAAAKFSQEWDFWMVDEYQDTSPVQVELLRHFIDQKRFFVVGDPQQSIYLFRGARSEVFQQKVDEVQAQGGNTETKLVNYRSSPEVLEFFNHYFTRLGGQFAAMTPAPGKEKKDPEIPVAHILRTETSQEDEVSAEILGTLARIQELLKEGISPEQICVLGRTHRTLEDIAKKAQEFGLPLQLHRGSGFYERREVLDALALLKFLVNPHDNANFVALLRTPWLLVRDSEIIRYCHDSKHSFWREAQKEEAAERENHPINLLQKYLKQSEEQGLSWTLKRALIDLGLFDYSAQIDASGRREANLWKVISLLAQGERRPGFNYLDFLDSSLETLSVDQGGEDVDATPVIEPKRVNFMTVHASKGLQFEHVILPGLGQEPRASHVPILTVREADGLWSLKIRNDETQVMMGSVLAEQVMEELRRREAAEFDRVLYVALTRAKLGVTLILDQKVGKKSWAAHCPLNLEEGLHKEPGFSYLVRVGNTQPEKMSEVSLLDKEARALWQGERVENSRKYISVTALVSPESISSDAYAPKAGQLGAGLAQAQQGTNAHRLFEALKYASYERLLEVSDEELKKPLRFLAETALIPLLEIVEKGHVEWGFAFRHNDALIQGQIDLWGVLGETLWMVDYKTGSQRYSDTAFRQLEVYAWALSQMRYLEGVKAIHLAVVYPMDEEVKIQTVSSQSDLCQKIDKLLADYSLV